MREILFRGKAMTTDRFVEGAYYHQMEFYGDECDEHYIISSKDVLEDNMTCCDEVFPETVGQYTGLTDKNGKEIFEGDIVKHFNNSDDRYDIGAIYFDTTFLGWRRTTNGSFHKGIVDTYKLNPTCIYEVIGNIHDNPELLKEGAKNDK